MQNLSILHEIAFNTSAITDNDMWNSQISAHKEAALEHNLELGLSYSPFSNVLVHSLAHQHPFQTATRTVLINLGPWKRLFYCAYARASQLVERAPVTPIPPCWGVTNVILCLKSSLSVVCRHQWGQHFLQGCARAVQPRVWQGHSTHCSCSRLQQRGVVTDVSPW